MGFALGLLIEEMFAARKNFEIICSLPRSVEVSQISHLKHQRRGQVADKTFHETYVILEVLGNLSP
jgi:hypothetical protein